jgi:dihydrofolate synthase/folylpolyglutamate synthase
MRVSGQLIGEQELADLLPEVQVAVEQIRQEKTFGPFITYEITTALALLFFQRRGVQHAIMEVGIGGRLDATNVLEPLVSAIASISFDHMRILGNTLGEIATEKAGIIKPGRVVVTSAQSPEALLAIAKIAGERRARMVRVGTTTEDPAQAEVATEKLPGLSYMFETRHNAIQTVSTPHPWQTFTARTPHQTFTDLRLGLMGRHQVENATLALAILEELRATGRPECVWDEAALRQGFRSVYWSARLEIIRQRPTIIVDGAHNGDSIQKLMQSLHEIFTYRRLIVVLGINADKDLGSIIQQLIGCDSVILTRALNPRAATLENMHDLFTQFAPLVTVHEADESRVAMDLAVSLATPDDLICATGSLYLAGEILRWAAARGETRLAATIEGVDH